MKIFSGVQNIYEQQLHKCILNNMVSMIPLFPMNSMNSTGINDHRSAGIYLLMVKVFLLLTLSM